MLSFTSWCRRLLLSLVLSVGLIPSVVSAEDSKESNKAELDPLVEKLFGAWVPNEAALLQVILDQAGVTDSEADKELRAKLEESARDSAAAKIFLFKDDLTMTVKSRSGSKKKTVSILRVRVDEGEIDADLKNDLGVDNVTFEVTEDRLIIKTRGRDLNRTPALRFDRISKEELEERLSKLEKK